MRDIAGLDPATYSSREPWTSWDGQTKVPEVLVVRPRTLRELVAAMWTHRARAVRAIGSGWSLSDVHQPVEVAIDLRRMVPRPRDFGHDASRYIRPAVLAEDRRFFTIRCGARLHQITDELWDRHSFPTLGGSHGQTLGGALSTSTHGGDFAYSSLTDAVRALHVVVPGGKEYWIESGSGGVTALDALRRLYVDRDDDLEILRSDDAFAACLVACGRLGVLYAALLEVVKPFWHEQETLWEAWKELPDNRSVEQALRQVIASGSWNDPLFTGRAPFDPDVGEPSFLEVHYDPKGPSTYVRRRWRSRTEDPVLPRPQSPEASHLGFLQFLTSLPSLIIPEVFAEQHRAGYARFLTDQTLARRARFKDVSHVINVGTLPSGTTPEEAYAEFERRGVRVESMEFFFDAMDAGYLDFVNGVHDQDWGTIAAGYIALRYTRVPTTALLGLARFAQTVAVEVTLIVGFRDASDTVKKVLKRAQDMGALSHWGQENPHPAPVVDRMFGPQLRRWREMIPLLLGEYANAPSSPFTRRKGLEYGPGLRIGRGPRTLMWLGYNELRTSTLFHNGFVGPDPSATALRFRRTAPASPHEPGIAIEQDGNVQAHTVRLPVPTDAVAFEPGSLTIRREGTVMAMITPRGDFHVDLTEPLPPWVTHP